MLIRFSAPKHRAHSRHSSAPKFRIPNVIKIHSLGSSHAADTLIELKFNLRNSRANDSPFPSGFVYEIAYATELLLLKILEHTQVGKLFHKPANIYLFINPREPLPSLGCSAHTSCQARNRRVLYIQYGQLTLSQAHSLSHTCRRKPALRTQ